MFNINVVCEWTSFKTAAQISICISIKKLLWRCETTKTVLSFKALKKSAIVATRKDTVSFHRNLDDCNTTQTNALRVLFRPPEIGTCGKWRIEIRETFRPRVSTSIIAQRAKSVIMHQRYNRMFLHCERFLDITRMKATTWKITINMQ